MDHRQFPYRQCSPCTAIIHVPDGQLSDKADVSCRALQRALPRAPPAEQQTIQDPAILHTTLARLLRVPQSIGGGSVRVPLAGRVLRSGVHMDGVQVLQAAVGRISAALCGLRVVLPVLW